MKLLDISWDFICWLQWFHCFFFELGWINPIILHLQMFTHEGLLHSSVLALFSAFDTFNLANTSIPLVGKLHFNNDEAHGAYDDEVRLCTFHISHFECMFHLNLVVHVQFLLIFIFYFLPSILIYFIFYVQCYMGRRLLPLK